MRSGRFNTAQNVYLNDVSVDNVYYNNKRLYPPNAYFVSNSGSNDITTTGAENDPFQTLNYAISRITDQDVIYFRTGSYIFDEQEITNSNISIIGYNGENVTFDGTRPISDLADPSVNGGEWQTHTTDIVTDTNQVISGKTIYKIKLNSTAEVWQLFHNRNEVSAA